MPEKKQSTPVCPLRNPTNPSNSAHDRISFTHTDVRCLASASSFPLLLLLLLLLLRLLLLLLLGVCWGRAEYSWLSPMASSSCSSACSSLAAAAAASFSATGRTSFGWSFRRPAPPSWPGVRSALNDKVSDMRVNGGADSYLFVFFILFLLLNFELGRG